MLVRVTDQAAGFDHFAKRINCGQAQASNVCSDVMPLDQKERLATDQKSVRPLRFKRCKSCLEFGQRAGVDNPQLQSDSPGRRPAHRESPARHRG